MHDSGNPARPTDRTNAPGALTGPTPTPATGTIPRAPESARRTSHIDMHYVLQPDGTTSLQLSGAARDLVTDLDGSTHDHSSASIGAMVDHAHLLRDLRVLPDSGSSNALLGQVVGSGFRQLAREAFPDEAEARTPLAQLLDDLPVAALIAGYMRMYGGDTPERRPGDVTRADICAGWRSDGTMMVSAAKLGHLPVPFGPTAPDLDHQPDDPIAWHPITPLTPATMRRRRLVDVTPDAGGLHIEAMFRDTHCQPDGHETVLHEYSLVARVVDGVVTSCVATPRVLPWVECPAAAASASRMLGLHVEEVRTVVRAEFVGTSTCTHLNDLLRSLGDVEALRHLVRH